MSDTKRRTTTSTAVKRRYNDKTYKRFFADIRIEDYDKIDAFIRSKGWSKAVFIKAAYELLKERTKMTIYYTCSAVSNTADIIISVDGMAWDYPEQLPDIDAYDNPDERESDLLALLIRWRDAGTLADIFAETVDDAKYPASEIPARFPTAKKL